MALIPLRAKDRKTVRAWAIVDDEDFEWLNQWRWSLASAKGYVARGERVNGRTVSIRMHRQILGLTDPEIQGDHINGNVLDNRRANLRAVTRFENAQNLRGVRKGATSRYRGVSFNKQIGKWGARVTLNRKVHFLGWFELEEDAALTAYEFRCEHMPFSEERAA